MDNAKEMPDTTPQGQVEGQTPAPETQTSEVKAQPDEAPESTGQAEEGEFQMPEKFKDKSAEEIAKSYTELEKHKTKVEMERAELEKMFVPETQEPTQNEPTNDTQEDPTKQVIEALTPKFREEFARLIAPVVAKFELKDVLDKYGEKFTARAQDVANFKKKNPSLSMEEAFKIVDYGNVERTSKTEGLNEATQTAAEKLKAQVESSQPSGHRASSLEDAINDPKISVSEIAEAVPELEPFARISRERAKM